MNDRTVALATSLAGLLDRTLHSSTLNDHDKRAAIKEALAILDLPAETVQHMTDKRVKISVFLDRKLHLRLKMAASRQGLSVTAFVARVVAQDLGVLDILPRHFVKMKTTA